MSVPARDRSVLATLERCGVVPVVVVEDPGEAVAIAGALLDGGIDCMEIAFRSGAAAAAIEAVGAVLPDMVVGAGTVLEVDQVDAAVDAGARFVVSPGYDEAILDRCVARSVLAIPGVLTPTEVQRARRRGLATLKFFPARAAGSVDAVRALAAVFGDVRFVPTGGVGPEDVPAYLAIPAVLACGGTWLVARAADGTVDVEETRRRAAEAAAIVRRIRG